MVTTKRSENVEFSFNQSSTSNVGLLEKPMASANASQKTAPVIDDNMETAKVRMKKNLDMLLNYDKVATESNATFADVEEKVETVIQASSVAQDEDIRPSVTTMQFGDIDIDEVRAEMKSNQEVKSKYILSSKGKVAIILFSLFVVTLLALIIINSRALSSYEMGIAKAEAELNSSVAQYNALVEDIGEISSNEYVGKMAEEMGMIKGE